MGRIHRTPYDLISASLLVSNDQRGFFGQVDISRTNSELCTLIEQQEETLKLLEARLTLFNSFHQSHTAEYALNSLRRGLPPYSLASESPTLKTELRTKMGFLRNKLSDLVQQRMALSAKAMAQKWELRRTWEKKRFSSMSDAELRRGISFRDLIEALRRREQEREALAARAGQDGVSSGKGSRRSNQGRAGSEKAVEAPQVEPEPEADAAESRAGPDAQTGDDSGEIAGAKPKRNEEEDAQGADGPEEEEEAREAPDRGEGTGEVGPTESGPSEEDSQATERPGENLQEIADSGPKAPVLAKAQRAAVSHEPVMAINDPGDQYQCLESPEDGTDEEDLAPETGPDDSADKSEPC
jgi:hypothetical protein